MKTPVVIRNRVIPFKGYAAINLFGVIFVRLQVKVNPVLLNHELIHTKQMKETWYIGFYLLYLIFWFLLLFKYRFKSNAAYRHIPFEVEAYANERKMNYLCQRSSYSWLKYLNPNAPR